MIPVKKIHGIQIRSTLRLPLFSTRVPAGFPSPADDYIESRLDLNEFLISHPSATFYVHVTGDSMTGAGIYHGDILIVDRAIKPAHGNIIIAALNGELTVKRLVLHRGNTYLAAENPSYPPIQVGPETQFEVWGVAIHAIHALR